MKLTAIVGVALLISGCRIADEDRPRFAAIASLSNEQLWSVGFRQAAIQELRCNNVERPDAERLLNRRYGAQERQIAARLGSKSDEEIILTLSPCSHFRGATVRYADALRELKKRLAI